MRTVILAAGKKTEILSSRDLQNGEVTKVFNDISQTKRYLKQLPLQKLRDVSHYHFPTSIAKSISTLSPDALVDRLSKLIVLKTLVVIEKPLPVTSLFRRFAEDFETVADIEEPIAKVKTTFIEFDLLDGDQKPFAGEAYVLTDSKGEVFRGKLDKNGFARVEPIALGEATVVFPFMDRHDTDIIPTPEKPFIEFDLLDRDKKPRAKEKYILTDSEGTEYKGELDANGHARIDNVAEGEATVVFPDLEKPASAEDKPVDKKPATQNNAIEEQPAVIAPIVKEDLLEKGYRPGYIGKENPASAPDILEFKKTPTILKDVSEEEFRKAFVEAALVMDDLGLNRAKGATRSEAYLDMVTWDDNVRNSWKNDHSLNTSSCGMFVRNIWWLCGARGTPLFDSPYKSGVLADLIKFDTTASKQWGSEFNAKTFFPKIGDVLYLYNSTTNSQHIFIICEIDKKIVDENGQATVYNADGSLASEITFTSVDGGQLDGVGPDGNGDSQTWGCQGIHKSIRKMKLNKGHFLDIGTSWPFPDKAAGRPINTWISIWEARAKFTGPLIKPVRHSAPASKTVHDNTSLYYLRIEMDANEAQQLEEKFVLNSTDGSYEQIKTAHDDLIHDDNYIDLEFTDVPVDLTYSLKIVPSKGDAYFLFEKVPFENLDGYVH